MTLPISTVRHADCGLFLLGRGAATRSYEGQEIADALRKSGPSSGFLPIWGLRGWRKYMQEMLAMGDLRTVDIHLECGLGYGQRAPLGALLFKAVNKIHAVGHGGS